jgi:hypothetical protein
MLSVVIVSLDLSSVTKIITKIAINLVTPLAVAKRDLLINKPDLIFSIGWLIEQKFMLESGFSGLFYKHMTIVNDNSSIVIK